MEKILAQAIPTPAVMESQDPPPPAKNLPPKPPESKRPFQFQTVTNQPSEHCRKRSRPANTEQETAPPWNQCQNQLFTTRKKGQRRPQLSRYREVIVCLKATYNVCKQGKQPKTAEYGHGHKTGKFGTGTSVWQLKENNTQVNRHG